MNILNPLFFPTLLALSLCGEASFANASKADPETKSKPTKAMKNNLKRRNATKKKVILAPSFEIVDAIIEPETAANAEGAKAKDAKAESSESAEDKAATEDSKPEMRESVSISYISSEERASNKWMFYFSDTNLKNFKVKVNLTPKGKSEGKVIFDKLATEKARFKSLRSVYLKTEIREPTPEEKDFLLSFVFSEDVDAVLVLQSGTIRLSKFSSGESVLDLESKVVLDGEHKLFTLKNNLYKSALEMSYAFLDINKKSN